MGLVVKSLVVFCFAEKFVLCYTIRMGVINKG